MKRDRKIVFITSCLSQPRCIKRIISLYKEGFECIVYGYDRNQYDINSYPEGIEVHNLGLVKNGEYIEKSKIMRNDVKSIIAKYGKDTMYYSFGFGSALFFSLSKVKFIYEISDVWYAYPKFDKIRPILKLIDKSIIKKSLLTIMTSGGFFEYYNVDNSRIIIQPNKVSPIFSNIERKALKCESNISFGFVGSLRYENVFRFAEVIGEKFPMHSFHFYGGTDSETLNYVESIVNEYPNIHYHGKFKNPEDLQRIYDNLDVVVACYDINSLNERIAEPNKLYESILFCKPIVVSPGIYLSKRVQELSCGYEIDASSKDSIEKFVSKLSAADIVDKSKSILTIPSETFIDNPQDLIDRINSFFNKRYL